MAHNKKKNFFNLLVKYLTSKPVKRGGGAGFVPENSEYAIHITRTTNQVKQPVDCKDSPIPRTDMTFKPDQWFALSSTDSVAMTSHKISYVF